MKMIFDFLLALFGFIVLSPIFIVFCLLIWRQDGQSPFYKGLRVAAGGHEFKMIKFRSMIIHANKSGVDSTSSNDHRITRLGHVIRRYKVDEIPQLLNILKGDMSFVGPRPNVKRETDLYTKVEKKLIDVKPGITDFASIVFADEGEILKDKADPDIAYNQLIRPWKSRLGLFYIEHASLLLDIKLIIWTVIAIFSREHALKLVHAELKKLGAPVDLQEIALRQTSLMPLPPPGADRIVESRNIVTP